MSRFFITFGVLFTDYFSFIDMETIKVEIVNKGPHALPTYSTALSAGMDVRAWLDTPLTLAPLQRALVHTGLYIALPEGFECQVRPRSGLALKRGLTVLNSPGTIDADYRGEIGVILANVSDRPQTIDNGERIAQLVVARHETVAWTPVDTLDDTVRGAGGFGSTGVK